MKTLMNFVAFDYCGWQDRYGRFTVVPDGETLVQGAWMRQEDWDKAQLEWFSKLDGDLVVHRCERGPYRETGDIMGTVEEIKQRLKGRLNEIHQH